MSSATHKHTECTVGLPLQLWLRERATLRHKCIACLVCLLNDVQEMTRFVETTSVCPSVCINHETVHWIFMKVGAGVLYEKLSKHGEFRENRHSGSHAVLT